MVGAKQFAIMRKIIEEKEENPIARLISSPENIRNERDFNTMGGSFLDKLHTVEPKKKAAKKQPSNLLNNFFDFDFMNVNKNNKSEVSEDLINILSYKVFQQIKCYLNESQDLGRDNKQHIKIDICI